MTLHFFKFYFSTFLYCYSYGDLRGCYCLLDLWYRLTLTYSNIDRDSFFVILLIGLERIVKDIRFMLGFGVGIYWKLTWSIIIPIALSVIFIYAMVLYQPLKTGDGEYYPPGVMGNYRAQKS